MRIDEKDAKCSIFPQVPDTAWFIFALAANIALFGIGLLPPMGVMILCPIMILLHAGLNRLNIKAGKQLWQVILLGIIHIIATYCVYRQQSWRYFRYIADDIEGRGVAWIVCIIGIVWTVYLLISALRKYNNTSRPHYYIDDLKL